MSSVQEAELQGALLHPDSLGQAEASPATIQAVAEDSAEGSRQAGATGPGTPDAAEWQPLAQDKEGHSDEGEWEYVTRSSANTPRSQSPARLEGGEAGVVVALVPAEAAASGGPAEAIRLSLDLQAEPQAGSAEEEEQHAAWAAGPPALPEAAAGAHHDAPLQELQEGSAASTDSPRRLLSYDKMMELLPDGPPPLGQEAPARDPAAPPTLQAVLSSGSLESLSDGGSASPGADLLLSRQVVSPPPDAGVVSVVTGFPVEAPPAVDAAPQPPAPEIAPAPSGTGAAGSGTSSTQDKGAQPAAAPAPASKLPRGKGAGGVYAYVDALMARLQGNLHQLASSDTVARFWRWMREWANVLGGTSLAAYGHAASAHVRSAGMALRARTANVSWSQVGTLGGFAVLSGLLVGILWHNRRLARQLAARDRELARLVMKVFSLQEMASSPRRVPIIRHTSCIGQASYMMASFPADVI